MSVDDDDKKGSGKKCPIVSEWVRHALYCGGMIALHTGLGATATVANKPSKCPISEWARHAVYVGGFVVLATKIGMCTSPAAALEDDKDDDKEDEEEKKVCPVNELYRHALYIAAMVGVVAVINSRKK
jgi:hypothetical protein